MQNLTEDVKIEIVQWLKDSLDYSLEKEGTDWGQDKRIVLKMFLDGELICKASVYE